MWQAHFEDVPPVLSFVVKSLIQNFHNLDEIIPVWGWNGLMGVEGELGRVGRHELVVGHLSNLVHLGT